MLDAVLTAGIADFGEPVYDVTGLMGADSVEPSTDICVDICVDTDDGDCVTGCWVPLFADLVLMVVTGGWVILLKCDETTVEAQVETSIGPIVLDKAVEAMVVDVVVEVVVRVQL